MRYYGCLQRRVRHTAAYLVCRNTFSSPLPLLNLVFPSCVVKTFPAVWRVVSLWPLCSAHSRGFHVLHERCVIVRVCVGRACLPWRHFKTERLGQSVLCLMNGREASSFIFIICSKQFSFGNQPVGRKKQNQTKQNK